MATILAVIDTPSIKKYVFGTDTLVEIRGASAQLDELNQRDTVDLLLQKAGAKKVYSNGGSGQFVFEQTTINTVKEHLLSIEKLYREQTKNGAVISWGVCEWNEDYTTSLQSAFSDMRRRREQCPTLLHPTTFPLAKECDSCSEHPVAQHTLYSPSEDLWLCEVCYAKREFANSFREKGIWRQFQAFAGQENWKRPKDFNEIGDYIGVVYADGNNMGKWIKELSSPGDFTAFSEAVDEAIRTACFGALLQVFGGEKTKADIMMLGGDDLVVVIEAEKALAFAHSAAVRFEKITRSDQRLQTQFFQERLQQRGFTISLGIAIGKSHHPFRQLLSTAEELLRLSKKRGASLTNGWYVPSCVDFHLMTVSNTVDMEDIRRNEYEYESQQQTYRKTRRPYTLSELETLSCAVVNLKDAKFPTSRLQMIYDAVFASTPQQARQRMREMFVRGREQPRKILRDVLQKLDCYQDMPWSSQRDTMLSELIELYDYLPTELTKQGEDE